MVKPCEFKLSASEPIFAVRDVSETTAFYRDKLGFGGEWLWGTPPCFGGVRWGSVSVMFCRQAELAAKVEGHQHFFRCETINELYEWHRSLGVPIVAEIENKPWGVREYVVRDCNGYHLRFAGPMEYVRPAGTRGMLPDWVQVVERLPSVEEYAALTEAVGWNKNEQTMKEALRRSLYGVVAVDTREKGTPVGMIRVVGDGVRIFYVQDVMVVPEHQGTRIGTAMMEAVMAYLRRAAPKGASVGLFTGRPEFYERFGFEVGGGMSLGL